MSNLSEEDKKILEKQIAKKVRSELDKEDFEDTAWLKAYSKANGKKDQAKVILTEAKKQIRIEKDKAISEIKSEVVDLSLSVAEKLINKNISREDNQALIDESLKNVTKYEA